MKTKSDPNKPLEEEKAPEETSDGGKTKNAGISDYHLEKMLLILPQVKWFEQKGTKGRVKVVSLGEIQYLYQKEMGLYKRGEAYREWSWATHKGTMGDRISAHTLLLLNSVAHNLDGLDQLVAMVTVQGRRQAVPAMDSLRQLLTSVILPSKRKLVPLSERPLSSQQVTQSAALLWYVEDRIRSAYHQLLNNLEQMSFDTFVSSKVRAARLMADLLAHSPEQELFLLTKLTNKLGDPKHVVGSKVAYFLSSVLSRHPNMKLVMVKEVERLLFRPNVAERAQYHAMCFLNQVVFQPGDTELARRMLDTYLRFFSVLSSKKEGAINGRMMKALLAGAARAFPFSQSRGGSHVAQEHVDALFNLVHRVEFGAGVQALSLLFQVLDVDGLVTDRFYSTLYRKLLDPEFSHTSHLKMFLNLLYCSLKKDKLVPRLRAFVKRILQVAQHEPPHITAGLLFLVSRLQDSQPTLLRQLPCVTTFDDDDDDQPEHYPDVKDSEDEDRQEEEAKKKIQKPAGWVHWASKKDGYNPTSRDPRSAKADREQLTELHSMARYFHPSVTKFHSQLLGPIQYSGDPLTDFTLTPFLDKFASRNPKKLPPQTQQSVVFGARKMKAAQKSAAHMLEEEKLLFNSLKSDKKPAKKSEEEEEEDEEELDEAFDNYLDFTGYLEADKKKKKKKEEEQSEDDFSEEDFDDDDEELNDAFKEFDEDYEEEERDLEEDLDAQLDDEELPQPPLKKKKKMAGQRSDYVDAEEINEMLEDNEDVGVAGSDFVNTDRAHPKQLQWERRRERHIKGYAKHKKSKFSKKRKFK